MVYRKVILILLIIFTGFYNSNAQQLLSDNKKALKLFRSAEQSFTLGEIEKAENDLAQALKKDPEFTEACLLLGDIYTEQGNYKKAIVFYKKALNLSPESFLYAYYLLGYLSFTIGDYESALDYYKSFLNTQNLSDEERINTRSQIENTELALSIAQHPLNITLENIGDIINSKADEYINFVDEKVAFLYMTRKEENPAYFESGNPFKEHFYFATFLNDRWDSLQIFSLPIPVNLNTGAINFSIDRKQLFFTGCSWPNSFGSCDIFQLEKTGNFWNKPNNMGSTINSTHWDSQAILSSDGKTLYFTSRRGGGFGGADIWKSEKQNNGLWGAPINLGDNINTSGNEMAPYIHADTKTFYFSSDTRPGLGGYDLFMSRLHDDGSWDKAENLGSPVNSISNEINIFVSIDAARAWISSDREGGHGGFDIYEFETESDIQPRMVVYIKGTVIDKSNNKPLSASVSLTNLDKNTPVIELLSDPSDGSFFIPLYPGTNYSFNITKNGYLFYSENFNFKDSLIFNSIDKIFALTPIQQGNSMVLKNIFFDFDSDSLKPASFPELDLLTDLLHDNPDLKISINGHTDNIGSESYNNTLSEDRARAVRNYLIEKHIEPFRLSYKGFGASQPIKSNDTPEGRAINRRTEIIIL
jgi:flagellar motor protein MotB